MPTKYPLSIQFRPLLVSGLTGGMHFDEQKNLFCHQLVVLVNNKQPADHQRIALFHEMLHMILLAAGVERPHDEVWIEDAAKRMAESCPEILAKIGVEK